MVKSHLASFEIMLAELLASFVDGSPTPTLEQYIQNPMKFNDVQVDQRKDKSYQQVLDEYKQAHEEVMSLIREIPGETLRRNGSLPWYGQEYDLEDFIVYTYYGHKREHSAQINVFHDVRKAVYMPQQST